jgi:hypothetical protein
VVSGLDEQPHHIGDFHSHIASLTVTMRLINWYCTRWYCTRDEITQNPYGTDIRPSHKQKGNHPCVSDGSHDGRYAMTGCRSRHHPATFFR